MTCRGIVEMMNECHMYVTTPAMIALFFVSHCWMFS